jgi:Fe-S cluster assembly protein SufD
MPATAPQLTQLTEIRHAWDARGMAESALAELQQQALDAFARDGFPSTHLEDWKYTDTRALVENYPQWLATQVSAKTFQPELPDTEDALHLVFVDGQFAPELSAQQLPEFVFAGKLADLATQFPQAFETTFGKLAAQSGFVNLNTAFASDAVGIILPDNTELDAPVYLSFFTTTPELTTQPRLLIDLGKNSRATVIEHYAGSAPAIVNTVSEARCDAGSHLTWYRLQAESVATSHMSAQYVRAEQDATVHTTQIDIGARLARHELHLTLAGRGAHAECKGLFLADDNRHVDSRITVEHAAPDTTSRERFRSVLADKARGVFNGRIHVHQQAQKTFAELTNRNLLLSPGAEINTKPELEIYADDVKCAHGSTTGQLDETALFYLLSRGIDPESARNLLIRAFVAELLTDITVPELRDITQDALEKLGKDHG